MPRSEYVPISKAQLKQMVVRLSNGTEDLGKVLADQLGDGSGDPIVIALAYKLSAYLFEECLRREDPKRFLVVQQVWDEILVDARETLQEKGVHGGN